MGFGRLAQAVLLLKQNDFKRLPRFDQQTAKGKDFNLSLR